MASNQQQDPENPMALNTLELFDGTDEECCSICKSMDYEDTDGFGYCSRHDTPVVCSDCCNCFVLR